MVYNDDILSLIQNTTKPMVYEKTVQKEKTVQGRPSNNSSLLELELSMSSTTDVIWVSATAHDIVGSSVCCTFRGTDSGSVVSQALLVVVFEPFSL